MDLAFHRLSAGLRSLVAVVTVVSLVSLAAAQGPGFGWRGSEPSGQPEFAALLNDAKGLLFINDRFVPLPCKMRVEADQLLVGDLVVANKPAYEEEQRPFRNRRPSANARFLGHELANHLAMPQLVVAITDQPLVVIS